MKIPTLKEFFEDAAYTYINNSYIYVPGFKFMYVRKTRRYIEEIKYMDVFDIANVQARKKGSGVFTRFIKEFRNLYPGKLIYVENVINKRFADYLERTGFTPIGDKNIGIISFYMLPKTI